MAKYKNKWADRIKMRQELCYRVLALLCLYSVYWQDTALIAKQLRADETDTEAELLYLLENGCVDKEERLDGNYWQATSKGSALLARYKRLYLP